MDEIIRSLRQDNEQTRRLIEKIHEETLSAIKDLDEKVDKKDELMVARLTTLEKKDENNAGFKKAIGIIITSIGATVIGGIIYVFSTLQNIQIILATLKK